MYLKSLTLRGFKSFADRTVMKFEPGVAAIVGPNGSGKSNISDAVLWVLGERNAKNLRGQSMEDVIFAGSSARKPVSVAEVELLLDNSDGTLPVDFAEVSIGRRMYRSGESEYLINGNVVRRMDVLDILHDSGLGTGTNSIISQGNLDSVLSSRPEDRRALIEEAAGILKHKERKAKSERKLAQMDAHLARVNDITAEVERQLKPLERKARKARTYEALSSELKDLRLEIAVDDLRILQKRWDETIARETDLDEQQRSLKEDLSTAERALDELQHKLQERGSRESSLNDRFRRAQASFERLNSALMVIREKRSGFQAEVERLSRYVEESLVRRKDAEKELEQASRTREKAQEEHDVIQGKLSLLEATYTSQTNERNELRKQIDTLMSEQRGLIHRQETIQATQEALKEDLSEKRARAQVIDAHVADAEKRCEQARVQADQLARSAEKLALDHEQAVKHESAAREELNALVVERENARHALDAAREAFTQASAERAALEELERASASSNPLLADLLEERRSNDSTSKSLSHALKVPSELESLVEILLGEDIQGILTLDERTGSSMIHHALASTEYGSARVISRNQISRSTLSENTSETGCSHVRSGRRLIDELEVEPSYFEHIDMLLGDVLVFDTFDEALAARREFLAPDKNVSAVSSRLSQDSSSFPRFAALDGTVVYPNGTVLIVHRSEEDKDNSALARRRGLEQVRKQERACKEAYEKAQHDNEALESRLRIAQTDALKLSETVANLRGTSQSASRDAARSAQTLEELEGELSRLIEEQKENAAFLAKAQPDSDELERDLAQVLAKLSLNKERVSELEQTLSPLRRAIVSVSEQLSDARLEAARLSERLAYAERMEQTRRQEIASSVREDETSNHRIAIARGASRRADELLSVLASLSDAASLTSVRLEQESRSEQRESRELHDKITQATRVSREARERFETSNARLADVRIDKGRLEIQVDAAIKTIIEDCNTPLERALDLEELEERSEVEQCIASLERRIKNMGSINPDAAQEFEEVNRRFSYLSSQLEDMRLARRSLARIVSVIDERMRNDFIETFERVNDNFAEIFSTLFPGGHAHLSLVDPDDLEHTGVDVNAQPVGKRVKKMSLLSGGEKSMTAMALLFAVYRIRQTPFYILDEVEAALDDTNLRRLIGYLNVIRDETQFIMITHQRRTMESADILYGVSMQADGITKVISQKLDNAQRKEG